ncbi:MAG: YbhB/YbcL family Raf kinase inhibitor-like protein [Hydrogenobacter thermophilus]|uniref:YbhB/YbcL family Raf kinase inhibitor-like protein n=1 Tax=Hydrogenobacter thermophilus TaxID=940 RepID=UPI0030F68BDD|nr:YbhB/YbcL family Raf kinase inhibitor-like protein [Hydrogenobacter thermophilus]
MKVESPSFKNGEVIPQKYTCDGENVSPPIAWSGFPEGTKSFVLIVDDPDAPIGTFTHWVVYDIPPNIVSLKENFPKSKQVDNIKQGINDFGRVGYGGPCPPPGHGYHRYFFKVYALNVESLGLPSGATKKEVESKMRGHILSEGQMMGRYRRD